MSSSKKSPTLTRLPFLSFKRKTGNLISTDRDDYSTPVCMVQRKSEFRKARRRGICYLNTTAKPQEMLHNFQPHARFLSQVPLPDVTDEMSCPAKVVEHLVDLGKAIHVGELKAVAPGLNKHVSLLYGLEQR